jgi:phosphoadenosine phosphosulfate reductase
MIAQPLEMYAVWADTKAFAAKVDRAIAEVSRAAQLGRMVVSVSWGKDSCALAHLVLSVAPGTPLMHVASSYELPGNDRVIDYFAKRTTIHTVPAKLSLEETIEWLKTHGLDYERDKLTDAGIKRKASAGVGWVRSNGYSVQALGMRAEESKKRRTCFRFRGLTYQAHGLFVSNPIGWWTTRDTWAYLVSRDVPWHRLYDCETHGETRETLRNSGWLTMPGAADGRAAWLKYHFPEQYRMLVEEFPQVRMMS